ncbi:MAG TPA: SigB/SigF/SigG family RNA polymerase sigma factor [Candidatus Dormibacteraeota bacterium]|nr:SigB/SigF/SigG family RNA polymerase sigma factor [Candidatus Dormibacteraeota bacterium]
MTEAGFRSAPTSSRFDRKLQHRLFEEYRRTRDHVVREQLVEQYTALVRSLARRFAGRGEPLEDLEQVGYLGLIAAIDRFEPEMGLEFTTFATPTILGEIKRYFRDKSWAVRVPRRLQETYSRVTRIQQDLGQRLGRSPTVPEIAAELGLEPDDVLQALEAGPAHRAVSLDAPAPGQDEAGEMGDRIGFEDENLNLIELRDVLGSAMQHLTPREQEIMILRFVEELPQTEVARRLGISQMHVSRLQRAALEQLKRELPE